ncbi:hypothetical protein QQ045_023532 [Rhodiola kirilowii]
MGAGNWLMHLWYKTLADDAEKPFEVTNGAANRINTKILGFQMPLHYPRFKKEDYEKMDEVRLKLLLGEYGLRFEGSLDQLRAYAIGTFLWPDQL